MTDMRFEDRMSDADALMWTIEKDPLLRSTITSVAVFDKAFDRHRLVEAVDRATRLVPRLRQRVVSNTFSIAPPRWEVDPNFDLEYHLRWVRAAGEGSLRDVLDLAEPVAMQGFDRARPLWEMVVVDGLEDGRAALVMKLHHAITDGVGGVKLAMNLFDLEESGTDRGPMPEAPVAAPMGQLDRVVDAIRHERRRQAGVARRGWRQRHERRRLGRRRRRRNGDAGDRDARIRRSPAGTGDPAPLRRDDRPLALGALRRRAHPAGRPQGRRQRGRRQAQRRLRRGRRRRPAPVPPAPRLVGAASCG